MMVVRIGFILLVWVLHLIIITCIELESTTDEIETDKCIRIVHDLSVTHSFPADLFTYRLSNKHIVFVGDSLMRYQYLALAYSLRHNEYLNVTMQPNLVQEKQWLSWQDFYRGTNNMLLPNEHCDCFRKDSGRNMHNHLEQFENRYYVDADRNITLTYLQYVDELHGHWFDKSDYEMYRNPQTDFYASFWHFKLEASTDWIKSLAPAGIHTVFIFNAGAHDFHLFKSKDYAELVVAKAKASFDQVIWKTTSYPAKYRESLINASSDTTVLPYLTSDRLMCSLNISCFNISWTMCVPGSYYWDNLHFTAPVYNHINNKLVEHLVPTTWHDE